MNMIYLTQSGGFLGGIAKILGFIMDGIFNLLDLIGIPNIGLSIILFTLVVYLLMMPLTIKQQKFSKLSAKMNPELQAIRNKYEGKKDNDSMMQMNAETQAVYAKYGVYPPCEADLDVIPEIADKYGKYTMFTLENNDEKYMEKLREAISRTIAEAQRKLHLLELDRDGRYKVYNVDV